jgi:hypothetical protein
MSLSNELKLLIIECLDDEGIEATIEIEGHEGPLEDNPDHLFPVVNSSNIILSLSRVNKAFRALAAPYAFKTLFLKNTEKSGKSIKTIADGEFAGAVKRLVYVGVPPTFPDSQGYYSQKAPKPEDFPLVVEHVLSHLSTFQNLSELCMEFPWLDKGCDEPFYYFDQHIEDDEGIRHEEETFDRRNLMLKSYAAVSRNESSAVKRFEMRRVAPVLVSAWESEAWTGFMSGLQEFSLSMRSGDNGAGWRICTLEGYQGFVGGLGESLFRHLTNVKKLEFAASKNGFVGETGHHDTFFPLRLVHFPQLEALVLENLFLEEPVLDFLYSHAASLRSLTLSGVFASEQMYNYGYGIKWDTFFRSVTRKMDVPFERLTDVTVKSVLPEWQQESVDEGTLEVMGDQFLYGIKDDKYGFVYATEDEPGTKEMQVKEDEKAWQLLVEMLEQNKTKEQAM